MCKSKWTNYIKYVRCSTLFSSIEIDENHAVNKTTEKPIKFVK